MPQKYYLKLEIKTEGKKGTQIKTGSVCNNDGMRKNKVVTYIQRINEELSEVESFSKITITKMQIVWVFLEKNFML